MRAVPGTAFSLRRLRRSEQTFWPGSQGVLPPPSPIRTVHATFTAHGSSLPKVICRPGCLMCGPGTKS
jgi:hypothetical protein